MLCNVYQNLTRILILTHSRHLLINVLGYTLRFGLAQWGNERDLDLKERGDTKKPAVYLSSWNEKQSFSQQVSVFCFAADFWAKLGGKTDYQTSERLEIQTPVNAVRLFGCSNKTGRFMVSIWSVLLSIRPSVITPSSKSGFISAIRHVRDDAQQITLHVRQFTPPRRPFSPDNGHHGAHYPTYTMVTYQRK